MALMMLCCGPQVRMEESLRMATLDWQCHRERAGIRLVHLYLLHVWNSVRHRVEKYSGRKYLYD